MSGELQCVSLRTSQFATATKLTTLLVSSRCVCITGFDRERSNILHRINYNLLVPLSLAKLKQMEQAIMLYIIVDAQLPRLVLPPSSFKTLRRV